MVVGGQSNINISDVVLEDLQGSAVMMSIVMSMVIVWTFKLVSEGTWQKNINYCLILPQLQCTTHKLTK